MRPGYALTVESLRKTYPGGVEAVKGISFSVRRGEIFGLIGPNGAGKTTTLRIVATLLRPTGGRVEVYGMDVVDEAMEVKKIIAYLPEESGAYRNLRGEEFLRFIARLNTDDAREEEEMMEYAAELSGLGDRLRDKVATYSKGMTRRLLVAATLMRRPRLAILDEPTSGLDVLSASRVRASIRRYVEETGAAVLLSSHNMLEVEYLCDRVAVIHNGVLVAEGEPRSLKEKYGARNLEEVFLKVVGGWES